jgi:hypothetical protein
MTKKSTHWVTIPEETIHTPVSGSPKNDGNMSGKSKLFWGAGFIVLVIVTVALLAPQQMASILQGNLFEQSGFQPIEAIPEETGTSAEGTAAEQPVVTPAEEPESTTVVKPETEAVTIQVEPIVAEQPAEELAAEKPVAEQPAEETEVSAGIKQELDANRQLLEDLSKQVAEFKEKDQQKTEIIEDLTKIAQEQTTEEVHPSAPETVSPAVTTTAAIGQVPTGYRVNTHTVTITPQQALQQNTAQFQMQQTVAAVANADYRAQLAQAEGTPDSGPKEALLLALSLAFISLLGWKIGKFARA